MKDDAFKLPHISKNTALIMQCAIDNSILIQMLEKYRRWYANLYTKSYAEGLSTDSKELRILSLIYARMSVICVDIEANTHKTKSMICNVIKTEKHNEKSPTH